MSRRQPHERRLWIWALASVVVSLVWFVTVILFSLNDYGSATAHEAMSSGGYPSAMSLAAFVAYYILPLIAIGLGVRALWVWASRFETRRDDGRS